LVFYASPREILVVAGEFKEWKPEVKRDRNIWEFQRGYHVYAAGQHESNDQFNGFQQYLHGEREYKAVAEAVGTSRETVGKWAKKYQWERRAAAWDSKQMALAVKDANKIERRRQRESIEDYRKANEDQARMMMEVSSDLMAIIQKRIIQAEAEGEKIPMGLVSGLMRAAANISDSGRQSWATALGVGQLMAVVDQELEEVQVEIMDEANDEAYDIPVEE
tara:strand:+ start:7245 stop:7904 length:660 start_codon:yes stop_codon:yes gene_type:complete